MPSLTRPKEKPAIRNQYDPPENEYEEIRMVYKRLQTMRESDDRQKAEKIWDKSEKQYENYRSEKVNDQWQSNHVVPMTLAVVETALSEIVDQQIRPIIKPRGPEDVPKAKVMQHVFDYAWEVSDSDLQLVNVLKDTLIFGTGIAQEYYWKDRRIIGDIQIKKGKETSEDREVFDYDDVYMEVVRLQDFYVDENARGFTGPYGARDCIRRYIMDIDDFKAFFQGEIWDPDDRVKYVVAGGDVAYYEFYSPPKSNSEGKEVEVLWYWNKPKDKLIIVANDVRIVSRPNPYRHKQLPFARCLDIKRTHRFYGKGEAEILESPQDEATTLRRMILDRNHLDIDKMFMVSRSLSLSEEDLIARPHGMIPVDDVNGAKAVEYGDIPRSVELSLKQLEDDATISTGINPRAQSLPTPGTATEAAILKESTLKRIRMKIWFLKKEFLTQISRLRVANILQFYGQPKLEAILGDRNSQKFQEELARLKEQGLVTQVEGKEYKKEFRTIPIEGKQINWDASGKMKEEEITGTSFLQLKPEYFMPVARGGYDIAFDAGATIQLSKPLMQSKMLELYDRIIQISLNVPNSYDPVKLTDMVIEAYEKDPNDYKVAERIASEREQQLAMQVELAQAENQQLMKGAMVPATPNASPVHTRFHIQFMNSEQFQQLPNESPIIFNFTKHIQGEIISQTQRELGGEQSEEGNGVVQGGISQGITNREGGMAKPTTKMEEMMPGLNTGGNKRVI